LLGHAVGFHFVGIAGLAYVQFGVNVAGLQQTQHGLIADRLLQIRGPIP
jgi:hypothetical protein